MYRLGVNRVQVKIKIPVPIIFSDFLGGKFVSSIINFNVFGDVCELIPVNEFQFRRQKSI